MIGAAFLLLAVLFGNPEALFQTFLFVLFPLLCIWFSDEVGKLTNVSLGIGRPMITHKTPGDFVAIGGWIMLLTPIALVLFRLTWD